MSDASVTPAENSQPAPPRKRLSVNGEAPIRPAPMLVQFKHPWAYRLSWCLVVAAHVGVIFAYNHEAYINGYILLGSKTEMAVQLLGLGATIRQEIGVTLVWSNRVLMAWHIYGAAQVIVASILYRQLVFRIQWKKPKSNKRDSMGERNPARVYKGSRGGIFLHGIRRAIAFYRSCGARGKHFNTAFDVRETIEIISQTVQAYTISCLITNNSVLHFVSLVLVLNCWSTPFLRLVFDSQEAKKRLLCLVVDVVFDFCCALAIPFLTFSLWEYQVATLDFFDDVWLIRSSTLLQYNLVNTWSGVITTRLPALGLILALETTKSLLHQHPGSSPTARQPSSRTLLTAAATSSEPNARPPSPTKDGPTVAVVPTKRASRFAKIIDLAFFVYGLVILILYTKAMGEAAIDQDPASNCALQLRPWGRRKAQCAVLDLDCSRMGITGSSSEIDAALHQFDTGVLASVAIANCPSLEVPPSIQELRRLLHLEIYNSTLVRWDSTAGLTKDAHPVLTGLFLVRVSALQNGLPPGLLSTQFPPSLCVVQIVGGDMKAIAGTAADEAVIRTHWPTRMFVFVVERTPLDVVPFVLLKKKITQTLSFAANNIASIPPDVFFAIAPSMSLFLGGNPIVSLPAAAPIDTTVSKLPPAILHVEATQISDVPAWILELHNVSAATTPLLWAKGSPFCTKTSSAALPSSVDCQADTATAYFPLAAYEARRLVRAGRNA